MKLAYLYCKSESAHVNYSFVGGWLFGCCVLGGREERGGRARHIHTAKPPRHINTCCGIHHQFFPVLKSETSAPPLPHTHNIPRPPFHPPNLRVCLASPRLSRVKTAVIMAACIFPFMFFQGCVSCLKLYARRGFICNTQHFYPCARPNGYE